MTRILVIAQTVWLQMLGRKDVYVLLILLGATLVTLVSIDMFGLGGAVRYVADIGLLLAWLFGWILSVHVASRELPTEESRGTLFPLLAKPVTRLQLLVGKWLGAWTAVAGGLLSFYCLIMLTVLMRGQLLDPTALLQGYLLHAGALAVIAAIAILFSTRLNHDAAASMTYVLTAASFAVVPRVPEFVARESGFHAHALLFLYNVLPHFEVFDMRKRIVHDYGPAPWGVFFLVLLYAALFVSLFLALAWLAYHRKRFARGKLMS
ncbi:MAG: ABC transporter permease subunit [Lentisphaerae bacterium]|nr:ABC transporter permease subunit [Lentisphaerota bacterium]